jgi:hypothetical protein
VSLLQQAITLKNFIFLWKDKFFADLPDAIIFQSFCGYNRLLELAEAPFASLRRGCKWFSTAFLRYLFAKLSMEFTCVTL